MPSKHRGPLRNLLDLLERYIVCTPEQRLVVALWVVHAHCAQHFEQTPYLLLTSPEKQCGKTTLLELISFLVPRPFKEVLPSEAVVYRVIERDLPTCLLDEIDAIFAPKSAQYHEGLRAILNAGNRRGATVPRCVGAGHQIRDYSVYCPKLIAALGHVPDTVADRSIPIRLQRKTRAERVEKFRQREAIALAVPIYQNIATWATEHGEALGLARPELPDELSDRAQDSCEPLLAIADELGYGVEARAALVSLLVVERLDSTEHAQLRLLGDIREMFDLQPETTVLFTHQLLSWLVMGDGEWSNYYGRALTARDQGALLRPYGIDSHIVRSGEETAKGYRRDDFHEAWERYLEPVEEAVLS